MPKKLGWFSKATEARVRMKATKRAEAERKLQEAEDLLWEDDDKTLAKKLQRREDKEHKRAEVARRKAEAKALLDEEMSTIKTEGKPSLATFTRQIEEMKRKQRAFDAFNSANKIYDDIQTPDTSYSDRDSSPSLFAAFMD